MSANANCDCISACTVFSCVFNSFLSFFVCWHVRWFTDRVLLWLCYVCMMGSVTNACDCVYVCPSVHVWRENECVPLETGSLIHPYTINGLSNGVMMVWSSACWDLNHLPVTCLPENTQTHTLTHKQRAGHLAALMLMERIHKKEHTK